MKEEPWKISEHWVWTEIKELGEIVSGGTPSTKNPSYWGDDVNWISPSDLTGYTQKTISKGAKNLTFEGLRNSSAKIMPPGSVHFSSRAPIGYVVISSQPISTNQGFKSFVSTGDIFNEYVYYYLKVSKYIAEERATGTTFKEISGAAFSKLPFPLPPFNEQKRIVTKIEELFSKLDKGVERLKTAQEQLKICRQAILKYAFDGKFTDPWRKENKDKLANWRIIKFGEIINLAYGKGLSKNYRNSAGKYPVYGSNGIIGYHDCFFIKGPAIIVGRKGAAGIPTYAKEDCWPIDTTYYVLPSKTYDLKFLYYMISNLQLDQFDRSTAIPGLNRDDVYKLEIALPSLEEQKLIVTIIEELFFKVDQCGQRLKTVEEQFECLHQAILKKAFSGQLVPQDPNDEPASILLERIRSSRKNKSHQ